MIVAILEVMQSIPFCNSVTTGWRILSPVGFVEDDELDEELEDDLEEDVVELEFRLLVVIVAFMVSPIHA